MGFVPSLSLWGWCRRDYGDASRAPPTTLASKREEQEVKSNKKFTLRYTARHDCSMWSLKTSAKHPIGVERGKARIGRARRMPPKVRLNRGRRGCLHNSSSNYRDRGSRWTSLSPYICKLHPSLRIGRAPVGMLLVIFSVEVSLFRFKALRIVAEWTMGEVCCFFVLWCTSLFLDQCWLVVVCRLGEVGFFCNSFGFYAY
jgi:hypothetical protein